MEEIIKKCLPTYEVLSRIGEGVYGFVFHVKDNLKERAVKVVPIMVERSLSFRTQQELDSKISHDFYAVQEYYGKIKGDGVIEIHDFHLMDKKVSKQEAKAYLIILMEFCPENLSDHVIDHYPLSPRQAKNLMRELAEILNRLSNRTKDAFIVKDLKPSNLLINKNERLLIGDLGGLQRLHSISTAAKAQFTPNWSAPELIINSETANIPSLLFSYGLVCYFIWYGTLPYDKKDFTERTRLIKDKGLVFSRGDMPYYIQGMIEKCLKFDPKKRPKNFNEIIKILSGNKRLIIDDPLLSADSKISGSKSAKIRPTGSKSKHKKSAESIKRKKVKKENIVDIAVEQLELDSKSPFERHQIGDSWLEPVTGMEFTWVPAGTFRMGSGSWDGDGKKDEFPAHTVYIDGFWMGKYLITQANWKKVMASTFWKKVSLYNYNPSWFKAGQEYPVERISWNEAQEFIQKLLSFNKGKYLFRLPTEAEWEYAARSCGKHQKYAGGKNLDALAWYSANSGMATQPVGTKLPNKLGLYDMSGNVYEWCLDEYSESAYKRHKKNNPLITGEGTKQVIRGGSWSNSPHEMRSTYRASVNQDFKGNYIGFRLVMTSVNRKKFNK
ncbi:MAG: SUMF1/EgtB/PvdO family nonheme iron enzyme [Desulfobacteraceae bacterium]|nr:SUMF1/EgtB/PvdO family nonheme iron enzyme [Desulfobacteraceae bacterium]MBC2755543.1 SUMF1/EgtB/PvdO family nonheme iron enzyme [Desulfobacteraceae bacterium]